MTLSSQTYDAAESAARVGLSNRAIQAFGPITFSDFKYPCHISNNSEILHYVDVMHETKEARYFKPELHQFSREERDRIIDVCDIVAHNTEKQFGRRIRPWMTPFAAMQMYRVISALEGVIGHSARVLEIGPGSGYLGAFLIRAGNTYTAMDNAQAFYLWQNNLFRWMVGTEFVELAVQANARSAPASRVTHMPWWEFAGLREGSPLSADIIVCDQALGEMSPMALRFLLRAGRRILGGTGPKFFVFLSPGAPHLSSARNLYSEFYDAGYRIVTYAPFFAFVPEGSEFYEEAMTRSSFLGQGLFYKLQRAALRRFNKGAFPFVPGKTVPYIGEAQGDVRYSGGEITKLDSVEAPLDYEFIAQAGYEVPLFPNK